LILLAVAVVAPFFFLLALDARSGDVGGRFVSDCSKVDDHHDDVIEIDDAVIVGGEAKGGVTTLARKCWSGLVKPVAS
jgi:hypothetical protein